MHTIPYAILSANGTRTFSTFKLTKAKWNTLQTKSASEMDAFLRTKMKHKGYYRSWERFGSWTFEAVPEDEDAGTSSDTPAATPPATQFYAWAYRKGTTPHSTPHSTPLCLDTNHPHKGIEIYEDLLLLSLPEVIAEEGVLPLDKCQPVSEDYVEEWLACVRSVSSTHPSHGEGGEDIEDDTDPLIDSVLSLVIDDEDNDEHDNEGNSCNSCNSCKNDTNGNNENDDDDDDDAGDDGDVDDVNEATEGLSVNGVNTNPDGEDDDDDALEDEPDDEEDDEDDLDDDVDNDIDHDGLTTSFTTVLPQLEDDEDEDVALNDDCDANALVCESYVYGDTVIPADTASTPMAQWNTYYGLAHKSASAASKESKRKSKTKKGSKSVGMSEWMDATFAIERGNRIRHNMRKKCLAILIAQSAPQSANELATNMERGVFNAAIDKATRTTTSRKWNNPVFLDMYVQRAKTVLANIDPASYVHNPTLLQGVYDGTVAAHTIAFLKPHELYPSRWTRIKELYQAKQTEYVPTEFVTLYTCGKCGAKKTTICEVQTRSADEPMTQFITCFVCKHRWRK